MAKPFYSNKAAWILAGSIFGQGAVMAAQPINTPAVSIEQLDQWVSEYSNWGRWGSDDQLGTLNLITPEKRQQAAALVTAGVTVSASRDVVKKTGPFDPLPLKHVVGKGPHGGADFAGDEYTITYHGWTHSHLDALSHLFYKGKMYNGFSEAEVVASVPEQPQLDVGAHKLGIEVMKDGIVSRGVLVDMPSLNNVPYLAPGTPILAEHLQTWEKQAGVRISEGDILLIRVGHWQYRRAAGVKAEPEKRAGLHVSTVKWLKERGVAVIGSDGTNDVIPSGVPGYSHPVHLLALHAMGMPILDNLDLDALADEAKTLKRWEFLFVVAPLRIPGGTGGPVNAIAVF